MKYINWPLVFPLFVLAFVAGAAPSVATNYLDLKFAHDFPEPYQATVAPKPSPRQKGTVTRVISTYSDYYIGRKMSNGVSYYPDKLTVASNDWKLGSRLRITYNGKSVTATVTDRMHRRFSGIRVDASTAVWKALGGGKPGLLKGAVVEVVK